MNQEPRRSRDSEEVAPRQTGDERAGVDMSREAPIDPSREERAGVDQSRRAALFHDEEARGFRSRWDAIQTGFVDEPRSAVEQADALVAQVVARVVQVFGEQRTTLERQWDRDRDISTEDLRVALTRYRAFFDRLLSV
jgi:hypothetical protein